MDITDLNSLSVVQLKRWLSSLGLSPVGTKIELMARLEQVPAEQRRNAPESGNLDDDHAVPAPGIGEGGRADLIEIDQLQPSEAGNFPSNRELLETIAQLQAELMAQRNRIPRNGTTEHVAEQGGNAGDALERGGNAGDALERDGNVGDLADDNLRTPTQTTTNAVNEDRRFTARSGSAASLSFAKEAAMDFNGQICARSWVNQLKNIGRIYELDAECLRMIFVNKMKGNAQRWLHASPTRMLEPFDQLCDQLVMAFGELASKSEMRRQFGQRTWQHGERFAMYLEEKLMLAHSINLDNEELMEQIIEGIPSANLRDQARIQRFRGPEEMRQAFANICLPKAGVDGEGKKRTVLTGTGDLRCRNCNSKGHFAKDCRKPKREPGSCFACGEMGHFVGQCQQRKSANTNNNYNAS